MYINISSNYNKVYRHAKALGNRKYREKNREFIVEGARIVKDAVLSSVKLNSIFLSDTFIEKAEKAENVEIVEMIALINGSVRETNCKIYRLSEKMFKDISHTETPQGIMAIVSMPQYSLSDIPFTDASFLIFCEEVTEPGNMGTIIRTADAAGVEAVILSKGCVDAYNPKVVRSAMGSLLHIPIISCDKPSVDILSYFKQNGVRVVTGDLRARQNHFEVNMAGGIVIVTGNEAKGISKEVRDASDELVKIPILGSAESLNAGMAIGILIYEAVRQRICKNFL